MVSLCHSKNNLFSMGIFKNLISLWLWQIWRIYWSFQCVFIIYLTDGTESNAKKGNGTLEKCPPMRMHAHQQQQQQQKPFLMNVWYLGLLRVVTAFHLNSFSILFLALSPPLHFTSLIRHPSISCFCAGQYFNKARATAKSYKIKI